MKNLNKLFTILFLITFSIINAQDWGGERIKGNGKIVTINRTTENYANIQAKGSFRIELVSGKEGNITIKGDENIVSEIVTEVSGSKLKVYFKNNYSYSYKNDIVITIPFEDISGIVFSGSGEIVTKDKIKTNDFDISFSGSGDANLELETNKLDIQKSGSGDVRLSGTATNLQAVQSGSGYIGCYNLTTKNASATLSGSGDIEVNCIENLTAVVSGSGTIKYKGSPKNVDKTVAGSGEISGK